MSEEEKVAIPEHDIEVGAERAGLALKVVIDLLTHDDFQDAAVLILSTLAPAELPVDILARICTNSDAARQLLLRYAGSYDSDQLVVIADEVRILLEATTSFDDSVKLANLARLLKLDMLYSEFSEDLGNCTGEEDTTALQWILAYGVEVFGLLAQCEEWEEIRSFVDVLPDALSELAKKTLTEHNQPVEEEEEE